MPYAPVVVFWKELAMCLTVLNTKTIIENSLCQKSVLVLQNKGLVKKP